ncbi:hypothetical protein [Curtobacterium sp. PhB136]|uniref:hypothetical protein n=1 Tax=Curtobacterium sp. PhB136 TaxID=2485181 RepID=UPI001045114F|nr:hypothetical protein [Curtobacterium sp. PhB136]TCK58270.1 hypothetical protein EDF27_3882 [Curtobacterium sp. PhB136]
MQIEPTDLVPLVIHVPAATLVQLTVMGRMRPEPVAPSTLVETLVDKAIHTPRRTPLAPVVHRTLDSLTGGDSMQMLAHRLSGYTTEQIAKIFGLSIEDTAAHFEQLDSAHRSKTHRQPRNRLEAIA